MQSAQWWPFTCMDLFLEEWLGHTHTLEPVVHISVIFLLLVSDNTQCTRTEFKTKSHNNIWTFKSHRMIHKSSFWFSHKYTLKVRTPAILRALHALTASAKAWRVHFNQLLLWLLWISVQTAAETKRGYKRRLHGQNIALFLRQLKSFLSSYIFNNFLIISCILTYFFPKILFSSLILQFYSLISASSSRLRNKCTLQVVWLSHIQKD